MESADIGNINRLLFLSILGILVFILAVFGLTYAFFAIQVVGNESASSVVIETANFGTVTFLDGDTIDAAGIYPMQESERLSKVFTITAASNTVWVDYAINFIIYENEFVNYYANEFTYTLSGVSSNSGTVAASINTIVPTTAGTYTIGTGKLAANGDTHTYTFTIGLNEVNSNQNSNQGKTFSGKLQVIGNKKYTAGGSIWQG